MIDEPKIDKVLNLQALAMQVVVLGVYVVDAVKVSIIHTLQKSLLKTRLPAVTHNQPNFKINYFKFELTRWALL